MSKVEYSQGTNIPVKRGKLDSLTIYEITDYELDQLEKGSPASIYLNFSIFLLSVGATFLIAILTTTIESNKVFNIFVIVIIISFIVGVILLVLWLIERKSSKGLISKIKGRCPW